MNDKERQEELEDILKMQSRKLKYNAIDLKKCQIEKLSLEVLKRNFDDFSKCEDKWVLMDDNSIETLKTIFKSLRTVVEKLHPEEYYPAYEEEVFLNKLRLGQTVEDMYNVYRVRTSLEKCPYCGSSIFEGTFAISRRDNKTQICSNCGTREAIEDISNTRF